MALARRQTSHIRRMANWVWENSRQCGAVDVSSVKLLYLPTGEAVPPFDTLAVERQNVFCNTTVPPLTDGLSRARTKPNSRGLDRTFCRITTVFSQRSGDVKYTQTYPHFHRGNLKSPTGVLVLGVVPEDWT